MPYFHKPPLYYWLSEFFFALFGPHPWLARLPSWMAAWGTSIALYFSCCAIATAPPRP